MTIGFLPPLMDVLEDQSVTAGEIGWVTQEMLAMIIMAAMMAAFWLILEEALEW